MAQQRRTPQAVGDRHAIGETVQGVLAQNGIVIDPGINLGPPVLQPLGAGLQDRSEFRQPAGPDHRTAQVRQQTEVFAPA